ncbi:DUF547 domain-containing protein [Pontixanthobacter aquaemixtae]|uniref:DUF547 domain-containing protein n=1 Tax=Pontixanthobacter aquaemixtae TaxID=1958940 RepID=A0A844ZSY2_9SPHN|nr:DUF547 domain-containing protein [Pontixanthobacter aquaemixtae]MXO90838.1 DUF547 domain-containing protein [Pontixanthobacter aquaemixtae]
MKTNFIKTAGLAVLLCTSTALTAQTSDNSFARNQSDPAFAQFQPKANAVKTQIDYTIWDEALKALVIRMGKSIREGAPRVEPGMATRRIYGHDSRYRLEGNRVGFSFFTEEVTQSLTEYRKDLEEVANSIDVSTLSRNEQLAFWMNLHNVAVVEQIALEYPVSQPSRMSIGEAKLPVDDAPVITIRNVKMSPKDIRTKIVYPNWSNPKVIYGFFRGDIGGPSIQRKAFTAANLNDTLDSSAREFINSLRGTEKTGSTMNVSRIYAEAQPFYFSDWPNALRSHYSTYAEEDVIKIMSETSTVEPKLYEFDIADLSNGERDPNYNYLQDAESLGIRVPTAIARLMVERHRKIEKIIKRGERVGEVTFIDVNLTGESVEPKEVE